ncbi:CPBP family intramembrane glutamic endopeptidase [Yeosuana sp. MJ-SS3]|uniref:CPBP family intramembrane glutamic endopeptidase n=1 Tax=Gilvirhabdus luticola TaxID=3079858 RepID=A0ABU3U799_9FLAO|nr:CPBP family intramembrane glutamic endopeptidase [Yeosuana sp. MJ-SS3]MDU8886288.1 CPBP family intramembrane glutamic endopeptidase [Yeosuana sp. MJ-SS3]
MMKSVSYKLIEFFIAFVIVPASFALNFDWKIKVGIGLVGFIYIVFVLLRIEKKAFKINPNLNWKQFWKTTLFKFIGIAVLTFLYVLFFDRSNLFSVVVNKPKLWIIILFIYTFLSVYPQELIYRTFFFERYQKLFSSSNLFIFINAIVFSLGHIFFKNTLVIILTFIGGLLFALTYNQSKSTLLVSIEHVIYGCWLFTVGMGDMLGFPS